MAPHAIHAATRIAMRALVLGRDRQVAAATHNILAYRIECGSGVWAQDADDDGEAAAGGRLLHLLQMADARNVAVVVTRWFGGVLLGPDRRARGRGGGDARMHGGETEHRQR